MHEVGYFSTESGRSQPLEFLKDLETRDAAAIQADIYALSLYGERAPVSMRPIRGCPPLWEFRTGRYRTFYVFHGQRVWILHVCKKQDQERGITAACKRMKQVLGG